MWSPPTLRQGHSWPPSSTSSSRRPPFPNTPKRGNSATPSTTTLATTSDLHKSRSVQPVTELDEVAIELRRTRQRESSRQSKRYRLERCQTESAFDPDDHRDDL